ncbi:MAG: MFS transporter, partial [Rickettsiaceae bacterium]|nr:MFS transporter [Rickettsiaceae bacterium]
MKAKDLIIPFLATILQYYDYALFGLSASRIAKSYLPGNDLLTFFAILTFAVVMRPVGSVLFGFVGDKRGRSVILKISIFLASVSTLIIGIIPASQNIYSAVLLILARMIFMMSLAGEIDSVRIYVAESIGKNREFLGNGIVTASSQIGVAVASFAVFLSDMVGGEFWRVSFIFGGVVGLIISIFARNIPESSEFLFNKAKDDVKPSFTILIFGILISGFIGGIYHFYMIFFKSY